MRRFILLAAVFAAGIAIGWLLSDPARTLGVARRPGPSVVDISTIAVHDGRTLRHFKVFQITTNSGTVDVGEPVPGNWIFTTSPNDQVTGWGQVTYLASPFTP